MTYQETCKALSPNDYLDGAGLSKAGEKVAGQLAAADLRAESADNPATDTSWGCLKPDALAEDEQQFDNMMMEGRL